jgi:rod shape-determining protein MreB
MHHSFPWFGRLAELAIDLGTANTRVVDRNAGMLFDEPSLCCFDRSGVQPALVAAGARARPMVDRTPASLKVVRPLRRGVLQDIDAARELLRYAVRSSIGTGKFRTIGAIIGVPADATHAERSALIGAASDAGIGSVRLVLEPFAAAVGAGFEIDRPDGSMIVECGAGTTEVAVISLGEICLTRSVRTGGGALDQALADHLHMRHKFLIGELSAEALKRQLVELLARHDVADRRIEIKGRSLTLGVPTTLAVKADELRGVVERHVAQIVDTVSEVLADTPPELSHDIHDKGIVLTGGSAAINLIGDAISAATGLRTIVADRPELCVANGLRALMAR